MVRRMLVAALVLAAAGVTTYLLTRKVPSSDKSN